MIVECPSDVELESFVEYRSHMRGEPSAGSSVLSHHVDTCPRCRARMEVLSKDHVLMAALADAYVVNQATMEALPEKPHAPMGPPRITGYEVESEIHRGGQGVVYRAVQRATKRRVALKVLLRGAGASVRQRQRFSREIDLASSLRHPNIVTIYDGGAAPDGNLYCAMEYVEGKSLDGHIREMRATQSPDDPASVRAVLSLFTKVCDAVHFAHEHGVIHRDLKPSNIVVDAADEPRVLDFGLAKIADPDRLAQTSLMTMTGEFMGTLAYASPEQTRGDPALIDARSDVYSLGVVLYEMLTGRAPYRILGAMADALRAISEEEPVPPSSWHRGEERINVPSQFPALKVDDEVETIVLKALSKEKARRYQSVEELRRDIGRYLEGDAIEAKRDSLVYVLRKKIRKHRLTVSIVTALAAISIGGAYWWDWGIFWKKDAESQQRRADQFEAKFALQERMLFIGGAAANVIPAPVAPGIVDRDATIRVNATPPVLSLNPLRTYSGELFVCDLLFESLFRRSRKSGLIPNDHLIDRLIDDPDARVKRVVLRDGLKWHDGHPLTAADVVFSWRQTTSKSVGAGKASIALLLEKVEAVSAREVRFEFREPRGAWRAAMNFELVPRHLFEKESDDDPSLRKSDYYKALHRKPVGCGPFRLVSWKNDLITLERWDEYERVEDRPLVRRVVISTIEKAGDQFAALMAGKLDVCMLTQKQYREEIYKDEFLKVAREARHPFSWYSMILWNCRDKSELFGDANVRRAMTYAININRIRAEVTNNLAAPCYGPWPVESPNFDPEVKRYAFNADIASDLLKEAGWQLNKSGQLEREKKDGEHDRAVTQPFEFDLLVEGINETLVRAAENCRKDLARVGVVARIDVVSDSNEFLRRYYKGDFDACMTAISPAVDPEWDRVLYESGSSANRGSYSNKQVDELFDQGGKLLDENERAKCYQRIHRILYEDQPCTFLFHEPALYAVSKQVEGIEFCDRTGPFLFYPGVRKWWVRAESGQ